MRESRIYIKEFLKNNNKLLIICKLKLINYKLKKKNNKKIKYKIKKNIYILKKNTQYKLQENLN